MVYVYRFDLLFNKKTNSEQAEAHVASLPLYKFSRKVVTCGYIATVRRL